MNKRKVPKIRFKGFHDDWEQRKFSDLVLIERGGSPRPIDAFITDNPNGLNWVKIGDAPEQGRYITKTAEKIRPEGLSKTREVHPGDLILSNSMSFGKPYIMGVDGCIHDGWLLIRDTQKRFDLKFLCHMLGTDQMLNQYRAFAAGSTVNNLNKELVGNTTVTIPSLEEQQVLGQYFENLDHLITLHQKKCFEWKKSGFSCASISWEQRKLSELLYLSSERNDGSYTRDDVLAASLGTELQKKHIYFGLRATDESVKNYKVVLPNDVIYTKSPIKGFPNGIIRTSKGENGIVPTLYCVYHSVDVINPSIIQAYFERKERLEAYLVPLVNIGARNNVNITDKEFLDGSICIPKDKAEQDKIVNVLERLSNLITLHQRKLELLKRIRNSLVNRCFIGEKCTMSKKILYHGSPNRVIVPKFGYGEDRHDYGRGFYLTENLELAKEWAVCRPDETNGWVHKYELEMDGLNILDFQKYDVLSWLAELMKHRDAADSKRYKMLAQKFIEKYGIDTCGYDVITGWRANAS